jgi:V/A-type H+-transporting ATPase subunit E
MENKIQELTDKLVHEGVERGNAEAERIISEANEKAAKIISDAKAEAEKIVAQGRKDVQTLNQNTQSELKMFCGQALNALKTEITNVLCDNVVSQSVSEVVNDKTFMQEFMLKLAEKWGAQEDLVISTEDAASLKAFFAKKAKALLDKKITIEQVNGQKTLFSVGPADGSYKLNFGNEEFEDYFKSFLRPQLVEMLF